MNVIGIAGAAGAGKSTTAEFLVDDYAWVLISFADPLKRICKEVFDFSDKQLWGESKFRNAPDMRYMRPRYVATYSGMDVCTTYGPVMQGLSPREALQKLGTEYARACYENVWVDYAMRVAMAVASGAASYDRRDGLKWRKDAYTPPAGVVFDDCRFPNELGMIKKLEGKVWLVNRPGAGLTGEAAQHSSETALEGAHFDAIIANDGTLEDLRGTVANMMEIHSK